MASSETTVLLASSPGTMPVLLARPTYLSRILQLFVFLFLCGVIAFLMLTAFSKANDNWPEKVLHAIDAGGLEMLPDKMTILEDARSILRKYPLVDGHNDLAWKYRTRVQNQMSSINLEESVTAQWGWSHTDIPRLREGMLGAQFWSCYVSCSSQYSDAVRVSLDQLDVIRRFVANYSDTFAFVDKASDIMTAFANGKIGSLIGLEGGHSIDSSLSTLRAFHRAGVRYMTLTHTCDTPWAGSSPADASAFGPHNRILAAVGNGGLTDFGKKVVLEMNRIGMMVDLAHVSKATMLDALQVSKSPVIFSHSSAWELCHHHRNVQDDVLNMLAANGGVVMVNFFSEYVNCPPRNKTTADLKQVADHIEHVRNVAGLDHVGIGGDYDGVDSMPSGLEDVSKYPLLVAELLQRGWTALDLSKLLSGNIIRVLSQVEKRSIELATLIPDESLISPNLIQPKECRTDF